MANKDWNAGILTGGTSDCLDDIDGALLSDGDHAFVVTATSSYVYILDDDAGGSEDSPWRIQPDSNAGTKMWILVDPHTVKQNLLTNSFGVWSNSLLIQGRTVGQQANAYDVGAAIMDLDGTAIDEWDDNTTRCDVTVGAGIFTITDDGTGTTMEASVDLAGLTVGALYKFSISLNNGTGTWAVGAGAGLQVEPNGGGANIAYLASETEAGARDYSLIWEATEVNNRITLVADVGAAQTVTFDNPHVIQVTPGCVAANALAMDGWYKKSGMEIFRQHNDGGTLTKDGSFYSGKMDSLVAGDYLRWPLAAIEGLAEHYQRFAGRTVTLGAWVKATTASHAFLQLVDSDTTDDDQSSDSSSYHTGGGAWEWLEVTMTVSATTTEFRCSFCFDSTTTAYISQPILTFGSSIGEGNYSSPSGEIVWFEEKDTLSSYNAIDGFSANITVNLEAESDGKVPKGIAAVYLRIVAECGTVEKAIYTSKDSGFTEICIWALSQVIDSKFSGCGWQSCGTNGDFSLNRNGTFNSVLVEVVGVQLR